MTWKKYLHRTVWSLLVLATLALPLAACSQPATQTPTASPTPTVSPTPTPTPSSESPKPTPTVAKEKIIRQTNSWPLHMDPAVGSDYVASIAFCNLYDTLVFPNPDGSVKPLVATKWDISTDGLTYTFEIRPNIKFHNGDALTAEDVVFSLNRIMAIGEGYGYIFITNVKEAKALDTNKVEITLKQPFGPFLPSLCRLYLLNKTLVISNIQKEGSYGELGDYGKDWLITHDAGSGPYKLKDIRTEEYMVAEKFTEYWGGFGPDAPDTIREIGTTEPVTVKTLMSRRELEISDQWQTSEAYASLAKIPGVEVVSIFSGSVCNIMLNTKKAPTDDLHFRRALAYCLDYNTVVNKLFPGSRQAFGPVAASTPGSNPDVFQFTQDMAKAAEELKLSKYADSLDANPVEIAWVAEVPDEEKIALLLQANAATLGITVNVVKVPWLTTVDNMSKMETTSNGTIVFVAPHYAEAGSMLESRYHSSSCGTWEQGEWLQDANLDKAIEESIQTIDQAERFKKYRAIQAQIVDLCPTIWLFDQAEKAAYQKAYISWPAADDALAGKPANQVMGYNFYFRDFKVFPDKIPNP